MSLEERVSRLEAALFNRTSSAAPETTGRAEGELAMIRIMRRLAQIEWGLLPFSATDYLKAISKPNAYSCTKMQNEVGFLESITSATFSEYSPAQQRWVDSIVQRCHQAA